MLAPAPGRLSMTTGCPQASASFCPSARPTMSGVDPAGNGTTRRTALDGYDCACAKEAAASAMINNVLRISSMLPRGGVMRKIIAALIAVAGIGTLAAQQPGFTRKLVQDQNLSIADRHAVQRSRNSCPAALPAST